MCGSTAMTTVLFLEPRDGFRSEHANALRSVGFDVISVHDSTAALESLQTRVPKILIARLDARTRDDHLGLCRHIKSDTRTKHISILLATDAISGDDVRLATDLGVLVLALPPDNGAKLVAAVQGILAGQRSKPLAPATMGT